jgi:prepilin-type N-terminal cleavage/methylation domain-containing protein/prepilin-type processing-associated H-X9-DG protein
MSFVSSSRESSAVRRGFTLIELLVVIAIIAILASILFPVFGRAREMARRTSCLSNEKQMGTAFMMYAQDYDEFLPAWSTGYTVRPTGPLTFDTFWDYKLIPYIKSGNVPDLGTTGSVVNGGVWKCPSSENGANQRSYGYSRGVAYDNDPTHKTADLPPTGTFYRYPSITQMDKAASTILIGDSGSAGYLDRPGERWYYVNDKTREMPTRHMEGANYLFADGHAKWLKAETVYPNNANQGWCSHIKYFAYNQAERDNNRIAGRLGGIPCAEN